MRNGLKLKGESMKKGLLTMAAMAAMAYGQANQGINVRPNPMNSFMIFEDSIRVSGTGTYISKAIWQDNFSNKAVTIEVRDDSSKTNFSGDSACVRVSALQVFPFTTAGGIDRFIVLNSRANPDSTTKYGSSVFNLWDSLDIHQMDTAATYTRNKITQNIYGGAGGFYPGDSIIAANNVHNFYRGYAYTSLAFDFSPAFALKLTGCATNRKAGSGVMYKIRVYGLRGNVVRTAN